MKSSALTAVLAAALASGCTLAPRYQRPALPVPDAWPADVAPAPPAGTAGATTSVPGGSGPSGPTRSAGSATPAGSAASAGTAGTGPTPGHGRPTPADEIGWRDFFADPRLRSLIGIALDNNRNLRVAVLNVAASQAQYRIQRSDLFPAVAASGAGVVEKIPGNGAVPAQGTGSEISPYGAAGSTFRYFEAGIGFTNYELDLFGRERSLSRAAFEQYLSSDAARRSAQISLVSEVAGDYFAVLADQRLLAITQDTLASQIQSYDLTKAMFDRDSTTLLSLRQAETAVDAARADLALYQRQLAQDSHALMLVLGQSPPADLPAGRGLEDQDLLAGLPSGLPSDLLQRRPDIVAAEHTLEAANANIGAARAAFFPSIQLTASGGVASSQLSTLFGAGTGTWAFEPTLTLPLFTGGQNLANLDLARVQKRIDVAQYELAIQSAFREVADALSARSTYSDQLHAQEALVAADADAYRLAQMRFNAGVDSYLATLDAERSLYAARQGLVTLKQAELTNEVTLYKALGGGWRQTTAQH